MNDRHDSFLELASQYKQETGIEIVFKLFSPPDIYSQKVIAAARANNLPDIFGILDDKKIMAAFIKANYILNLSSYMDADEKSWHKSFYSQALDIVTFLDNNIYAVETGIYGVPIDMTVIEFLYNKDLFKKAGLNPDKPPVTFEEFINYAKIIKETTNSDGFVCGWGEPWLLNSLSTLWALNIMGENKFFKTLSGEISYTDQDWIKVFTCFDKLRESKILASDITTMVNKEAEDLFSKGKVAFSFNGSWAVNIFKQLSPNLNYAFFPLPKISEKHPIKIWGGAGSSFMVNAKSPKIEEVIKFLKWITAKKQQEFLLLKTNNLPSIKDAEIKVSEILKSLPANFNNLTHPNIWPYNEDYRVSEVLGRVLQQIVMGLITPQEGANEIQKVKERTLSK
ncbi:MAG: extracellular solute-binding protein [Candidatus Omnitrophica bacterium]|nr:extracellular solute-binding protein [Candidatus Omnitrophota bacterium]